MATHKNRCVTHREFFPKENELRYEFEFNSIEGICTRCQEQVAKIGPTTNLIQHRQKQTSESKLNTNVQFMVTQEMKSTMDYIAKRKGVNKAEVYREAFSLYILYRSTYESD